ncbi:hypothetical protein Clacol_004838 [Clathrus columnatus]|uniref:Uncharacterized protein n=1 Tax=Clathrus columnatus TaxID=1419009 RepID=A0AAV5ADN7_9AGAM|nr:hypothetical protein Clacol_004838 [Clathrus columnatus]
MITDHSEGPLSSNDEKKSYDKVNAHDHSPPLYAPPPYPPHSYSSSANLTAGTGSQTSSVIITRPSSAPPSDSNHKPKRDPLNPLPPSFSRPVPRFPPLPPFPPLTLNSKGSALNKGFPISLPIPLYPSVLNPNQQRNFIHPFSQRDVLEEDWKRLLEDIYITAQLTTGQKIGLFTAHAIPAITGVGLIGGILVTKGIHRRMKKKRIEPVADLVDVWNQYFFHKRGLHVILAHGPENISGEFDGPAPDWIGIRAEIVGGHVAESSFSSDSSSGDELEDKKRTTTTRRERREARRAAIKGKIEEKREERRASRARRKAEKNSK